MPRVEESTIIVGLHVCSPKQGLRRGLFTKGRVQLNGCGLPMQFKRGVLGFLQLLYIYIVVFVLFCAGANLFSNSHTHFS